MTNFETYNKKPENDLVLAEAPQPEADILSSADDKNASKLHYRLQKGKSLVRGAIIAAEVTPFTNEGLRYGAFGATLAETHSPALGAAVLGGTTLLVEGAGAIAAAGALAGEKTGKAVKWANQKSQKIVSPGAKIPRAAEAGIAITAGTPILMTLKNTAEPGRTLEQNRRYGIFTASWMAAIFAAEGGLVGNSVEHYNDPKLWAASVVALGGLAWAVKRSKALLKKDPSSQRENKPELTPELIKRTTEAYMSYHDSNDETIRLGLFGEDLEKAITNPETISFSYTSGDGENLTMPLLVPAETLEWYDAEALGRLYGEDKKFFSYIHPPLPADSRQIEKLKTRIKEVVNSGAIIITDQYVSQPESLNILQLGERYTLNNLGVDGIQNQNNAFVGKVDFEGVTEIKSAQRLFDVYQTAISNGEIKVDNQNGLAMVDIFSDKEVDDIWVMYSKQFSKLGENDPSPAGFQKNDLKEFMQNPLVAKIIFRVNGEVASLCFFNHDFETSPWFNKTYFEKEFPDYVSTGNVVMFPGIVSDESRKGSSYSGLLVDFAMSLYNKRGSNAMLTFECTQISSRYIPRIVKRAINNGEHGNVSGLEAPVSTTVYKVLTQSSHPE